MKTWALVIFSLAFICSFSNAYDPNIARELLRASTASYCQAASIQTMKCGAACNDLRSYGFSHYFQGSVTQLESVSYSTFVNPSTKRVVFAFRGTSSAVQLLKEGLHGSARTYDLHGIPNALATRYFFEKYKTNLRNDFLNTARTLARQHPDFQFYFTGHSLGGALTSHAALDVSLLGIVPKNRIHVYTFGSPRVGDYNLAQAMNNNAAENYRIVHDRDIVPHLPPCITDLKGGCTANPNHSNQNGLPVWNTYHTGTEIFYDQSNPTSYRICSRFEDPTCSKKYKLLSLRVGDHLQYLGLGTSC